MWVRNRLNLTRKVPEKCTRFTNRIQIMKKRVLETLRALEEQFKSPAILVCLCDRFCLFNQITEPTRITEKSKSLICLCIAGWFV